MVFLALTLKVAGFLGHVESKPHHGVLITALILSVGQGLGGVHLRTRGKFCRKVGTEAEPFQPGGGTYEGGLKFRGGQWETKDRWARSLSEL